ncbi:hypothetical protein [Paraflavitalea sp. CAU 1676]|uniref:hypothetical protein n=1 Tax=Paraflavitalea sp. CAU 1676 TaxID=3032598 RepID=UPI0023DA6D0E|nr:hypothetical protein [Paraflavitalea sp. CAU 1676]MDF2193112.1 hypothetical protein [Paraflavitalea sp. CAU 1676]
MKKRSTILILLILLLLLWGMAERSEAQTVDFSKTVANITTGGNGTSASEGNILEYTIVVKNLSTTNYTNAILYDNIPAGSAYVPNSTFLNGAGVADASGKMPYSNTGNIIQSPAAGLGVLVPNVPATIRFRVRVTANGGNINNFAMLEYDHQSNKISQNSNKVFTNLSPDPLCTTIYQSTAETTNGVPQSPSNKPYRYIRTVNTTNGTAGPMIYDGANGLCYNALTGAALAAGSVLTYASAIAYDKNTNRIYFVNNYTNEFQDLSYIDLNVSPVVARRFVGYPLETNLTSGYNINRMSFCSDGFGYAITQNGRDIIRFSINAVTGAPDIVRLGALINDVNNGSNNILNESGGDIFGDGSGNLYLIANSSKLYKINPNTRVSTFLGSVNPFPGTSNSMAVDPAGNVYIGGAYRNVFNVNLASMAGVSLVTDSLNNVWTSGDYTSCGFPVLAPVLEAIKTYRNINGHVGVIGGDTVEYVIEVINTGNLNAAGVKLYDYIPANTAYIPNSTKLNGVVIPDVSGMMPFSLTGGRLINTAGQPNGIIRPGVQHKVVMTFRVKTALNSYVCNQSRVTLFDINGNPIFINSDDPTQPGGGSQATCFYTGGVLPANSFTFKASLLDDKSVLQWSVKEEYNIEHHDIEYSNDGSRFVSLGSVKSKGNTMGVNNYQFTDEVNTLAPARYYRIKTRSFNGKQVYSSVVRLSIKSLQVTRIMPNPFDRVITVQLQLKSAGRVQTRLVDMFGRVVVQRWESMGKGVHSFTIEAPAGLAPGTYVMEIIAGTTDMYQQKLIKQ